MKYIDSKNYEKVKKLAESGDEQAKDFLASFMDMDDKKANEYLLSLGGNEGQDLKESIEFLINDENEAIDGYDKAIKFVANSDFDEEKKKDIINVLEHIKAEEIEHIKELKEIL